MSYFSGPLLDGYSLNTNNNSFVSKWVDTHSAPFFDIRAFFSSNSVSGTLTLETSDDKQGVWTDGSVFPESARYKGTYGTGPTGDPNDLMTTGSSVAVSGNATGYGFSGAALGARWMRLKYLQSSSVTTTVSVFCSWKTSS